MTASYRQLRSTATSLATAAGVSPLVNLNTAGQWRAIAEAAEELAGATTTANTGEAGYMRRAALALESIAGTSGAEENPNAQGLLKRIVDALEVQAGGVTSGPLGVRLAVAAAAAEFTSYEFANAEAEAVVARMSVAPDDDRKALIDNLVGSLKSAGVWNKLAAFFVMAAHDAQAARLDWKGSRDLSVVGSPIFNVDEGYASTGAPGDYLASTYNPTTHGGYAGTSGHLGSWPLSLGNGANHGGFNTANYIRAWASTTVQGSVGSTTGTTRPQHAGSAQIVRRSDSDMSLYIDGGSDTPYTTTTVVATPNAALNVLRRDAASATSMTGKLGAFSCGAGLSAAEVLALHNAVAAYFAAVI